MASFRGEDGKRFDKLLKAMVEGEPPKGKPPKGKPTAMTPIRVHLGPMPEMKSAKSDKSE